MKEYKSFYKEVGGNEGGKCHYNIRLDTYGCGCQHDCSYCYAKSLLEFRGLWDAQNPSVADIDKIRKKVAKLPELPAIRLGGMTDCFQPIECISRVTFNTIKALNEKHQPYLIVTKSDLVGTNEYMDILDKDLAHIQVTVTNLNDNQYKLLGYEKASLPSQRINAIRRLQERDFDVAIRLSPLCDELMDYEKLNSLGIEKAIVEFLRVNARIEKWFSKVVDLSKYTVKQSNYRHLPLEEKIKILKKIKIPSISVCEDEDEAYQYWKENFNPNPDDCCNLR